MSQKNLKITKHAHSRMKERVGIGKSKDKFESMAEKALERGIKHSEVKGKLRKYMDSLYLHSETANNMRIYANQVFLFNDNNLITVLPLPSNFQRNLNDFLRKDVVRKKQNNENLK